MEIRIPIGGSILFPQIIDALMDIIDQSLPLTGLLAYLGIIVTNYKLEIHRRGESVRLTDYLDLTLIGDLKLQKMRHFASQLSRMIS